MVIITVTTYGQAPTANNGILDARSWNFSDQRIALNGNWIFYEDQLISATDTDGKSSLVHFPKTWNEIRPSGGGSGYATYHLTVLLPQNIAVFALEIPQIYCSYKLWINGQILASNGKVGATKEETIPQWRPQTISFKNPGDTLHIHLQIANFHHYRGGSKDPIYLGTSDMLQHQRSISVWSNLAETGILIVLGIVFLVIYWGSDRKRITIYFALVCLTWALRSLFSNQYLFISYFPDFNWTVMVKTEYITLYLSLIWAMLFTHRLFPNESANALKYLLIGANILYILLALLAKPIQFTEFLSVYLFTAGTVLLYCAVVVLRAWINERIGVVFLVISMLLGLLIFTYDLFAYEGFFVYNAAIFGLGYLTVFLAMAMALLLHLKIIKSKKKPSNLLTYKDLYGESGDALR